MDLTTHLPLENPLPLTVLTMCLGLAAWANGLFFLGYGAEPAEGGAHPLKTVGWISLVGGVTAFGTVFYLLVSGGNFVAVAGLASLYDLFFIVLGAVEIHGLDLKPVANISIPIAVLSLPFLIFFDGLWLFQTVMVVWTVAFAAIAATVYGRLPANVLGWILVVTAIWTFFLPAVVISLGIDLNLGF